MKAAIDRPAGWWESTRGWLKGGAAKSAGPPRIGLALGGGFARGIAHIGVLRALEKNEIPIHAVTGVSSGSIVAASMASGCCADEIERVALSMKFRDVARWTINVMGLAGSDRMISFLTRLLKVNRFEDMRVPLGIVATDLLTGKAVHFHGQGDVVTPIRASCSYPGLFQPIRHQDKLLVDGFVAMEVPAAPLLKMGCDRVISVAIPNQEGVEEFGNMLSVVSRCFQIMGTHAEHEWKRCSSVVITPPVANMSWDSFHSATRMIELGEQAAMAVMPTIRKWLAGSPGVPDAVMELAKPVSQAKTLPVTLAS